MFIAKTLIFNIISKERVVSFYNHRSMNNHHVRGCKLPISKIYSAERVPRKSFRSLKLHSGNFLEMRSQYYVFAILSCDRTRLRPP